MKRIKGTLHENQYTFLIISRSILLRMRNVSDKSCRENQLTHFVFSNFFFLENRAVYEMWKNTVQPERPQITIWPLLTAFWIPTQTHSVYVIFTAFPLQQW